MSSIPTKSFNLRWHQHSQYLISLHPVIHGSGHQEIPQPLIDELRAAGMREQSHHMLALKAPREWKSLWDNIYATLTRHDALELVEAAVTPLEDADHVEYKPVSVINAIADNLWLGDALINDRLICYLQPVIGQRGQVFGYESFARVRTADGGIIGGARIIAASHALNIEYTVDRHLHVQALKTFAASSFNGFLFVNLFPDFIHRPEVYLEGIGDAAKKLGIVAKHIVLDVMRAESPRDAVHLKNVCDYARSRGMSVALDDIESLAGAHKLVPLLRPDFVKLDAKLTRKVDEPATREIIRLIVELVHEAGGSVIAEGVESEAIYKQLEPLSVDLYQGYLFSPPLPVEAALKRVIN